MDLETMQNLFVGCFEHYKNNTRKVFVIHEKTNQLSELIDFLNINIKNDERHISFNGITFDSQIIQYILDNQLYLEGCSTNEITGILYDLANTTIERSNNNEFPIVSERNLSIKQLDVFKLNHWDSAAKRSGLKWIQYSMDWHNLMDMPIYHGKIITKQSEVDMIVKYCINDVKSTKEIYTRCVPQVALRKTLSEEYNLNLYSASEPKISKGIFLHFLSNETGINKYELKKYRTQRESIIVKDIILDYIKFEKLEFQQLLRNFNKLVIDPSQIKGSFSYKVQHSDVETTYGLGGIHGANKSGVYKSDDENIIMSSDVTSFYPNLAIRNKWAPAHIDNEIFSRLYEWFFDERKKIPKKDPKNYVYKIILNSTFGLSIEENSFLYDPQLGMQITINGQLTLTMLYEQIMTIPGAVAIMQNTDGVETLIPRKYIDRYMEICNNWEKITSLNLEHTNYNQVILADVNNYIAESEPKELDSKINEELSSIREINSKPHYSITKCKGRFEFRDVALHKNKSKLVVAKAIYAYFILGIQPEEYLKSNTNIMDYCIGFKARGDWKIVSEELEDTELKRTDVQKTVRYYVSKKGDKLYKLNSIDGRTIQLEAGKWRQTLMLKYQKTKKFEDYDIDKQYYLQAIKKEIKSIENKKVQHELLLKF